MVRNLSLAVLVLAGPVLLGQQISFQDPVSTPFNAPVVVVSADFNGDGKLDLAVADVSSDIKILLGKGDGSFADPVAYGPPRCEPVLLKAADFTGDGVLDLLTFCGGPAQIYVLPGKGDGTFLAPIAGNQQVVPLSSSFLFDALSSSMAIADFNGDGKLDIAAPVINTQAAYTLTFNGIFSGLGHTSASILYGRGNGTFDPPVALDVAGAFPVAMAAGDFNSDGKLDLVVAMITSPTAGALPVPSLLIFYGDGQGHFTKASKSISTEMIATNLVIADVNGDGKPDLLLSGPLTTTFRGSSPSMTLAVMTGDGAGGFHKPFSTTANGYDAVNCVAVDLRGSGTPDLIDHRVTWTPGTVMDIGSEVLIHPGNGDGTFGSTVTVPLPKGELASALAVGDFDGDGRYDLALAHASGAETAGAFKDVEGPLAALAAAAKMTTGTLDVLRNVTPPVRFTTVNAASFLGGSQASGSIVSAFGGGLAQGIAETNQLPLPTTLGMVTVTVADSAGVARPAPLFYVSPRQINFEIPDGTAAGQATATLAYPSVTVSQKLAITTVAPGVFNSQNLAVGNIVWVKGGQQQITSPVQADSSGNLVPVPIDVTAADQVFLVLYGTGIRNHANPVTAKVGTTSATVAYAGPQGVFVGEDQINIQLPTSLKGAGLVDVVLTVDGLDSNPAKIQLQ